MSEKALTEQEKYIHREISWLRFNDRVLDEALDTHNPLLERLKFLAIFVSNLDEFFMVRYADLKNIIKSGINRRDRFGYYPQQLFQEIREHTLELTNKLYDIYENKIKRKLEKEEIFISTYGDLNKEQKKFAKEYFESTLYPIITPMAVDPGHPFPILPSKTIAFAINVKRDDLNHLAIIPLPKNVNRMVKLPAPGNEHNFILLDDIIREHLDSFFRGYKVQDFTLFRVIRDSELAFEEEYTPDLLKAIEDEVRKRSRAKPVYLEIEKDCSAELLEVLCEGLKFPVDEVRHINSILDLTVMFELLGQVDRPDLCDDSYLPHNMDYENIFDRINEEDFIIHVPFQSFSPTVDLIESAAKDPGVLAIKMTLYRTNTDSAIINALVEAAQNQKQVTILVEIKARFDEENNIKWVRELEEAGCHVIYGMPGLKVHAKMALIVRKEEGQIRRYVHLSTGNYNEKTSKVYTDVGYFTSNEDFARDISDVFNVVTGYSTPSPWKRIVSSPHDLREYFFSLIDREIKFQKKHGNGRLTAKLNSLEDPKMIDKLYEASQEGVKIDLIVRGICCLRPGVKGLSENITVRSIVGRFLEHTRIFMLNNNGNPRIFMSSADWMRRNLERRIELLFEIYNDGIKEHLKNMIKLYMKDNVKVRLLKSDGEYERPETKGERFNVQENLIKYYGELS